jgi:hypothetical protein
MRLRIGNTATVPYSILVDYYRYTLLLVPFSWVWTARHYCVRGSKRCRLLPCLPDYLITLLIGGQCYNLYTVYYTGTSLRRSVHLFPLSFSSILSQGLKPAGAIWRYYDSLKGTKWSCLVLNICPKYRLIGGQCLLKRGWSRQIITTHALFQPLITFTLECKAGISYKG